MVGHTEIKADRDGEHAADRESEHAADRKSEHAADRESEHAADRGGEHTDNRTIEQPTNNRARSCGEFGPRHPKLRPRPLLSRYLLQLFNGKTGSSESAVMQADIRTDNKAGREMRV